MKVLRSRRGFTLIEVIITSAILGTIAYMDCPSVNPYHNKIYF